jgi:hypothetical protein
LSARLDFILDGAGWATLEINGDDFSRRIEGISYITDALDDLLRMGIDIATDKGWSFAQFDHEPATTILVAETGWSEDQEWKIGARLSSFSRHESLPHAVTWNDVHTAKRDFVLPLSSRDELARMFLGMAERVRQRYGESDYQVKWGGRLPFPTRAMVALKAALDC